MFKDCFENSTAHGIPHIVSSDNRPVAKFVWSFIFLGSLAVFLFHSSSLVEKYLLYETSVSVNLNSIEFMMPDIYVCSNYKFSKMLIEKLYQNDAYDLQIIDDYLAKANVKNLTFFDDMKVPGYSKKSIFNLLSNRSFMDVFTNIIKGYSLIPPTEVLELVPHDYHTYCYKLKNRYKKLMFELSALTISLYTDAFTFMPTTEYNQILRMIPLVSAASHTVYVVPEGRYPSNVMPNAKIEVGKDTTLSISMNYHERVSTSKAPCREEPHNISYRDDIDPSREINYIATPYECETQYILNEWINRCNCSKWFWPLRFDNSSNPNYYLFESCELENYSECNVKYDYENDIIQNDYNAKCQKYATCKLPIYSIKSESISLNDVTTMAKIMHHNIADYPFKGLYEIAMKVEDVPPIRLQNSFVKVTIYAPSRRATVWKETFSYELKDLLSDIGGILGFYIGVSVVTCLEIFGYAARYLSLRSQRRKQDDNAMELLEPPKVDV